MNREEFHGTSGFDSNVVAIMHLVANQDYLPVFMPLDEISSNSLNTEKSNTWFMMK